jgi:hypothetical protein
MSIALVLYIFCHLVLLTRSCEKVARPKECAPLLMSNSTYQHPDPQSLNLHPTMAPINAAKMEKEKKLKSLLCTRINHLHHFRPLTLPQCSIL